MKITLSDETATRIQILTLLSCLPDDLRRTVELDRIECAHPRWDGTAAQFVEDTTWIGALRVALRLGFHIGDPCIGPSPDGSVRVEWNYANGSWFRVRTIHGHLAWEKGLGSTTLDGGEAADLTQLTRIAILHRFHS